MDKAKCPVCGNETYESIRASGSEWSSLILGRRGSCEPKVCLQCGILYIDKDKLKHINETRK